MTAQADTREYWDANIRWLQRLPVGWRVLRLRYLADIETGSGDTQDADPDGIFPFIVRSDDILASNNWTFDTEAILTSGDGAGVGEVFHHVQGKFLAHQRVYVLSNFRQIEPRFFFYYFSEHFRLMALDGSAKSTVDSVRRWMLTEMPVPVPPLSEQQAIADFLDEQTAKIDTLVTQLERVITLLEERRGAALDVYFQSRNDKQCRTVKQTMRKMMRPAPSDLGVITAYRDGTVTLRTNRREEGYTFSESENGYQEVCPGDVVFHALDGFAGAVGVSDSHGVCTPVYHVCQPTFGDDPDYIALELRQMGTSGLLATLAPNVRQRSVDFRNWSNFARVPLWLPHPSEQRAFVERYRNYTVRIDTAIAQLQSVISLLSERRATLITEAVTGRLPVTCEEG